MACLSMQSATLGQKWLEASASWYFADFGTSQDRDRLSRRIEWPGPNRFRFRAT